MAAQQFGYAIYLFRRRVLSYGAQLAFGLRLSWEGERSTCGHVTLAPGGNRFLMTILLAAGLASAKYKDEEWSGK